MPTSTPASGSPAPAGGRVASEHLLRAFLASPAMMAITRLSDGALIDANQAFLDAGALTREQALGRPILELGIWVDDYRRLEYRHLLQTKGRVQDYEARFRNRLGVVRDMMLNAEVVSIEGEPCAVVVALDVTERRRREREQETVYRISEAAIGARELPGVFERVHAILGEILSARNFFIALYDQDTGMVSFPLWNNEVAPEAPPPRPLERSLTDYVILSGKPLLLTDDTLDDFTARTGHFAKYGRCKAWLAAPLLVDGRPQGVIALQDYSNANAYRDEDMRLLVFVAEQLATVLRRVEDAAARHRSEALQRASQDYFARTFQASPALMALARLDDGGLIEANAAFLRVSGFSREEVLGKSSLDLGIWPDPRDRVMFMERLREKGSVRDYEAVFFTKFREPRYVSLNADILEVGGVRSMLITAIDLTERRRREQVQEATYQISRVLLAGGNLAALFAEVHRIIAALMPARNFYVALLSPEGDRVTFPYFVDEHVPTAEPRRPGNGFTEHILRTGRAQLARSHELVAMLRVHGPYEPVGRPAAVRLGAPLVIEGRAIGVIAVQDYHDPEAYGEEELRLLTFVAGQAGAAVQRQQAEEALARAEQQYRGIFEHALEGLYQSSETGQFLRANPALARMFGYETPEELMTAVNDIGRQLYADANRRAEFMQLVSRSDEVTDFESEVIRRDGTRMWVSESVRVLRPAKGGPAIFEGVAIDITAQREAARALREAKEAADEASRAKSQFLASMSHELRTPLNGILGYTQILRRDPVLTDKQRDGLGVIHQSAEHLLALINDVLDLAKIEARKLELHPEEFDLREFAVSVAEFFGPKAREKSLLLETAFSPGMPRIVIGDAQRLRQVLFNLLSNAIKFTDQGGVVFSVERVGPAVRFSVSDSGPGIPEADQARLYEPFAQLGDRGQRAGGTGLGLNVSRNIVQQMGGRIAVESRPGWGTRFWFDVVLPEATVAGSAPRTASPWRITGYDGPRRRVLIADDHAPNRAVLVDLLQPLGFEVAIAQDGEEAVTLGAEWKPDLVLMDVKMPKLDGFAATRALRRQLGDNSPCVISISATAQEHQHEAALAAGCAAFLAKPFREDELLGLIGRHLGIAWRHADAAPPSETSAPFPALPHAPSETDANALFELASRGDVLAVRAFAQQLGEKDARLAPFSQQVIELASRFKMKAIRQLAARYRGANTPS